MIINGINLSGINVVDGSIITQNLAIWIDADNASSYSGTGTTITDLSGNGRTQNLDTASQYTVLNGVKCFNCIGNDIQAAVDGPVLPTTGFTYIVWANLRSSTADYRTLLRSFPNDHAILIQINNNNLGMWDNIIDQFFPAGYTVEDFVDVWAQWAVVGDSSGQIFYINGVQVGSTVQTAAGNSHRYLGGLTFGQSFGYIANMELYTSKLTQQQIQQNYYGLRGRFAV